MRLFTGYCLGFVTVLSIPSAVRALVTGRNLRNFDWAIILGVITFALIKSGRSLRRSVAEG